MIFELRDGEFSDVFDTFLFDLVASSINATTEMAAMIVVQRLKDGLNYLRAALKIN